MRCVWCNQSDGDLVEVIVDSSNRFANSSQPTRYMVHPEHRDAFLTFHERKERYGKRFLFAVFGIAIALAVLEPILLLMEVPRIAVGLCGVLVSAIGVVAIILPFGTPETVSWLGWRRTISVVRWAPSWCCKAPGCFR